MSELYGTTDETAEATDATRDAEQHDAPVKTTDYPDVDTEAEAMLADEQRQPEPSTRQEAAAGTWDDASDLDDSYASAIEHDGDTANGLAEEENLPEPRTQQETAADTWGNTTDPDGDNPDPAYGDAATEHDEDAGATAAEETRQPEPRTRQEAAADTWSEAANLNDNVASPDAPALAPDANPGTAGEVPSGTEATDDGAPDGDTHQIIAHTQDGTEVPINVTQVPAEARTLGDDTPTGIGRKPTGEDLLERDDPAENPLDRLFRKATEEGDDLHDAMGSIAETAHDFDLRPPGSGHAYAGHSVYEPAAPASPAFSDIVGGTVLVGVAVAAGTRHLIQNRHKGDRR